MVLDQPINDETEDDGEKNDELDCLHIRQLLQMVLPDDKRGYSSRLSQ